MVDVVVNHFNPRSDPTIHAMVTLCVRCLRQRSSRLATLYVADGSGFVDKALEGVCAEVDAVYLPTSTVERFARTYNRGLSMCGAEYIALTANDIFVPPAWDQRLMVEMERTRAWMAAPYLSYSDYVSQRRYWVLARRTFVPNYLTFNLNVMTRECYSRVGPISEQFTGGFNDWDYLIRIRAAGGEVIIADAGEVVHYGRATTAVRSLHVPADDRAELARMYPNIARRARYRDGCDPLFCRSRSYALLLHLAGSLPIGSRRHALLRLITRLEPRFHAV